MKNLLYTLLTVVSLFLITTVSANSLTITSQSNSNQSDKLTTENSGWARLWVSENLNSKSEHTSLWFNTSQIAPVTLTDVKITVILESLGTKGDIDASNGDIPLIFYVKDAYDHNDEKASWGTIDYPTTCSDIGTYNINTPGTTDSITIEFSSTELTNYINTQIAAGKNASIMMRTTTEAIRIGFVGADNASSLTMESDAAVGSYPSVKVLSPESIPSSGFLINPEADKIRVVFSKAMDKTSVESKLTVTPATGTVTPSWVSDDTLELALSTMDKMTIYTFTVEEGALAADGIASGMDFTANFTTSSDQAISVETSSFWQHESGSVKTNELSCANGEYDLDGTTTSFVRTPVVYYDLAGTDSETEFEGIILKQYKHSTAEGWLPRTVDTKKYKLYDVTAPTWGISFTGSEYASATKTEIAEVTLGEVETTFMLNSQEIKNYLASKAGQQICISIEDAEVDTFRAVTWFSTGGKTYTGAPVITYKEGASAINSTLENEISLYPQPVSNGILNIKGVEGAYTEVYSLTGTRISSHQTENNQVDVSHLNSGIYLLKLSKDNEVFTQQFMIK